MKNILKEANEIVNKRSEEKERQYGSFSDSMDAMRDIFNAMTGLELTTQHMFMAMVALKLSRQRHAHKQDNLLDAVAYLGALDNYMQECELDDWESLKTTMRQLGDFGLNYQTTVKRFKKKNSKKV